MNQADQDVIAMAIKLQEDSRERPPTARADQRNVSGDFVVLVDSMVETVCSHLSGFDNVERDKWRRDGRPGKLHEIMRDYRQRWKSTTSNRPIATAAVPTERLIEFLFILHEQARNDRYRSVTRYAIIFIASAAREHLGRSFLSKQQVRDLVDELTAARHARRRESTTRELVTATN